MLGQPSDCRCFVATAFVLLIGSPLLANTSNSLLDVSADGKLLLAANPDNGTITVVDLARNQVVHEIAVGDKPEGVTWLGKGHLAAAAVYCEDLVVFFDAESGKIIKKLPVPDEPYGIIAAADGRRAWVTHEYPGTVTEIDVEKREVLREMKVGNFVRGIAYRADENRLYITEFYTGSLLALDLETGKVVDSWKGQSPDNLARHVVLHPRRGKAYLSHVRSRTERALGAGSIFPQVSICDLIPEDKAPSDVRGSKRRRSIPMDTYNGVYVTTNCWESDISPDGKRLYTIYAGTDDMNVSRVIDDDYQEIEAIGRPVQLGKNPRAVRVSPDGARVYVYNAMDFEVAVFDAETMRPAGKVKVCEPPKTPEWVRGKILFNTAKAPMSARRWVACSSCHPDGHTDGRVWSNPEGLRKTPAMLGLAHTHPLHWSADRDEVQDFEYTIRSPLMAGSGLLRDRIKPKVKFDPVELDEKLSGRSRDLDALAIYSNSFEFTLSPHAPDGRLSPAAERGRKLFASAEVGCASCHSGPYYTDSRLERPFNLHDVGTGNDDPGEKMGPKYDTPTLLGVYRTPPYLHHGKAKTLHDVLTKYNEGDKHGKTSHLKPTEIDDLVEFLKALPYELPPDETPNTVKDRVIPKRAERSGRDERGEKR
jgi:YVTN family beta-propeller protein